MTLTPLHVAFVAFFIIHYNIGEYRIIMIAVEIKRVI
jgi:hypothetical protein